MSLLAKNVLARKFGEIRILVPRPASPTTCGGAASCRGGTGELGHVGLQRGTVRGWR